MNYTKITIISDPVTASMEIDFSGDAIRDIMMYDASQRVLLAYHERLVKQYTEITGNQWMGDNEDFEEFCQFLRQNIL